MKDVVQKSAGGETRSGRHAVAPCCQCSATRSGPACPVEAGSTLYRHLTFKCSPRKRIKDPPLVCQVESRGFSVRHGPVIAVSAACKIRDTCNEKVKVRFKEPLL